ncbi:hypothetical protein [Hungatella sp. SB206]|uniref:hypothetical protein n=1 Tax=Hungatella sp. SB206 TaxID=2937758 RepID=UPI003DA9C685
MKIARKFLMPLIMICMVMIQVFPSFASEDINANEFIPLETLKGITTFIDEPVKAVNQNVSALASKSKTANIVGNYGGKKVGTITLNYQTQIIGGRPQFIYDTCEYEISSVGLNVITITDVVYSNDNIRITFSIRLGPSYDVATVNFTP